MNRAKYRTKLYSDPSFRAPTEYERERVTMWVEAYYASKVMIRKVIATVLIVVGLLLMGSIGNGVSAPTMLSVAVGLLCFLGAYKAIKSKRDDRAHIMLCKNGDFSVCDGWVSKLEVNMDTPGCVNARFTSDSGSLHELYRIRTETAQVGMRAILIRWPDKKLPSYVFTPFMLTDEGIKLHW